MENDRLLQASLQSLERCFPQVAKKLVDVKRNSTTQPQQLYALADHLVLFESKEEKDLDSWDEYIDLTVLLLGPYIPIIFKRITERKLKHTEDVIKSGYVLAKLAAYASYTRRGLKQWVSRFGQGLLDSIPSLVVQEASIGSEIRLIILTKVVSLLINMGISLPENWSPILSLISPRVTHPLARLYGIHSVSNLLHLPLTALQQAGADDPRMEQNSSINNNYLASSVQKQQQQQPQKRKRTTAASGSNYSCRSSTSNEKDDHLLSSEFSVNTQIRLKRRLRDCVYDALRTEIMNSKKVFWSEPSDSCLPASGKAPQLLLSETQVALNVDGIMVECVGSNDGSGFPKNNNDFHAEEEMENDDDDDDAKHDVVLETDAMTAAIKSMACAIGEKRPVLLEGPAGCGKTTLIREFARRVGLKEGKGGLVFLHLDDQIDSRSLIGTYTCTDIAGEFKWSPGVLTQAILTGKWLVFEDVDRAPVEVLNALTPLLSMSHRYLHIAGRSQSIQAAAEFRIFFTRTISHASQPLPPLVAETLTSLVTRVRLPQFDDADLDKILSAKHPLLSPISGSILRTHRLFVSTTTTRSTSSSSSSTAQEEQHEDGGEGISDNPAIDGSVSSSRSGDGGGDSKSAVTSSLPSPPPPRFPTGAQAPTTRHVFSLIRRIQQLLATSPLYASARSRHSNQGSCTDNNNITKKKKKKRKGIQSGMVNSKGFTSSFTLPPNEFPHPLREHIVLDAVDIFLGSIPRDKRGLLSSGAIGQISVDEVVASYASQIGQVWGISPGRVEYLLHQRAIASDITGAAVLVGRASIHRERSTSEASLRRSQARGGKFSITRHSSKLMEALTRSILMNEPVLLVGETGNGKTAIIQHLANLAGRNLMVQNLNNQTDAADLLGGFRPVELRAAAIPVMNTFGNLFPRTLSKKKNHKFIARVKAAFDDKKWRLLARLLKQGASAAQNRLVQQIHSIGEGGKDAKQGSPGPSSTSSSTKRRSAVRRLQQEWGVFQSSLKRFTRQVHHAGSGFAFWFAEGSVVKALKEGAWLLLDEVNLASPETLDRLTALLDGRNASLALVERGDARAIRAHPEFRVFAAMNPATDFGKRDLPHSIRSRFTELYVSDITDKADLEVVVRDRLGSITATPPVRQVVHIYLSALSMVREGRLLDGSGNRPNYSLRTLCRALGFTVLTARHFGFHRALKEGLELAFLTPLDQKSRQPLVKIIEAQFGGKKGTTAAAAKKRAAGTTNSIEVDEDNEKYIKVDGGYLIRRGTNACIVDKKYVITPTVRLRLREVARAIMAGRYNVLLQGPTSAGKTSLIEYLAKATGNSFVRINNHDHTDLQDYMGGYVSDSQGRLTFQEGALVKAVRNGHWVVLDELNLAPSEVLEALNRLLDDNRELLVPETGEVIRPHPSFLVFATQNPPGVYGGRKTLSRAFKSRFVEIHVHDIPERELAKILELRCAVPPSHAKVMIDVMCDLQKRRQGKGHDVFAGKHSMITPRDLFRWGNRGATSYQELADVGFMLLGERHRTDEAREIVRLLIESHCRKKQRSIRIDPERMYSPERVKAICDEWAKRGTATKSQGQVGQQTTRTEMECDDDGEEKGGSTTITWTPSVRRMFILVEQCLRYSEPVLLVGPTGCGKTTVCQYLASLLGQDLRIVNCHQHTESSDFLGGLRPVRNKHKTRTALTDELMAFASCYSKNWEHIVVSMPGTSAVGSDHVAAFLKLVKSSRDDGGAIATERQLGMMVIWLGKASAQLMKVLRGGEANGDEGDTAKQRRREKAYTQVKEARAKIGLLWRQHRSLFLWKDGALVSAMREGDLLLIDEISLAEDAVLERLNSVLEPSRTLLLAEKGGQKVESLTAEQSFRVLATMNPGGDFGKKELSPALRNRFTELWIPPLTDRNDLVRIVTERCTAGQNGQAYAPAMLDFVEFYNKASYTKAVGGASLRDVLSWVDFLNCTIIAPGEEESSSPSSAMSSLDARSAFIHGAHLVFLDGLGIGTNHSLRAAEAFKAECEKELARLAASVKEQPAPSSVGRETHEDAEDGAPAAHQKKKKQETGVGGSNSDGKSSNSFGIEPFFIKKGSEDSGKALFRLDAPTTLENLKRVLRAMQLRKAVLLEGSPGVGKTTLITALAKAAGHKLVRINLSEQTDMMDLLGTDLPKPGGKAGEFQWCDGVFLSALKHGAWVLLDELNLASQSVLEGLNSVLDHRGTVYIPELDQTFACPPGFKVFACQNPTRQGGGRRALPRSFLSRFTKVYLKALSKEDLLFISSRCFPNIPAEMLAAMIAFNSKIQESVDNRSLGTSGGGPWEFNLRDVFRWCELMKNSSRKAVNVLRQQEASSSSSPSSPSSSCMVDPSEFVEILYAQRMRNLRDRVKVWELWASFGGSPRPAYGRGRRTRFRVKGVDTGSAYIQAGKSFLACQPAENSDGIDKEAGAPLFPLRSTLAATEHVMLCVSMSWPILLIGPGASGKTSIIEFVAQQTNNKLHKIIATTATDSTELLGCFEQLDLERKKVELLADIKAYVYSQCANLLRTAAGPAVDGAIAQAQAMLKLWFSAHNACIRANSKEGRKDENDKDESPNQHRKRKRDNDDQPDKKARGGHGGGSATAVSKNGGSDGGDDDFTSSLIGMTESIMKRLQDVIKSATNATARGSNDTAEQKEASRTGVVLMNRVQGLAHLASDGKKSLGSFEWIDGVLVQAMQRGEWVVIENSNLCQPTVLDRLNPLLEPGGELLVNECGLVNGKPRVVTPHPGFRLFLTMNPSFGEVSRAMRNRCVEISLCKNLAPPLSKTKNSSAATAMTTADADTPPSVEMSSSPALIHPEASMIFNGLSGCVSKLDLISIASLNGVGEPRAAEFMAQVYLSLVNYRHVTTQDLTVRSLIFWAKLCSTMLANGSTLRSRQGFKLRVIRTCYEQAFIEVDEVPRTQSFVQAQHLLQPNGSGNNKHLEGEDRDEMKKRMDSIISLTSSFVSIVGAFPGVLPAHRCHLSCVATYHRGEAHVVESLALVEYLSYCLFAPWRREQKGGGGGGGREASLILHDRASLAIPTDEISLTFLRKERKEGLKAMTAETTNKPHISNSRSGVSYNRSHFRLSKLMLNALMLFLAKATKLDAGVREVCLMELYAGLFHEEAKSTTKNAGDDDDSNLPRPNKAETAPDAGVQFVRGAMKAGMRVLQVLFGRCGVGIDVMNASKLRLDLRTSSLLSSLDLSLDYWEHDRDLLQVVLQQAKEHEDRDEEKGEDDNNADRKTAISFSPRATHKRNRDGKALPPSVVHVDTRSPPHISSQRFFSNLSNRSRALKMWLEAELCKGIEEERHPPVSDGTGRSEWKQKDSVARRMRSAAYHHPSILHQSYEIFAGIRSSSQTKLGFAIHAFGCLRSSLLLLRKMAHCGMQARISETNNDQLIEVLPLLRQAFHARRRLMERLDQGTMVPEKKVQRQQHIEMLFITYKSFERAMLRVILRCLSSRPPNSAAESANAMFAEACEHAKKSRHFLEKASESWHFEDAEALSTRMGSNFNGLAGQGNRPPQFDRGDLVLSSEENDRVWRHHVPYVSKRVDAQELYSSLKSLENVAESTFVGPEVSVLSSMGGGWKQSMIDSFCSLRYLESCPESKFDVKANISDGDEGDDSRRISAFIREAFEKLRTTVDAQVAKAKELEQRETLILKLKPDDDDDDDDDGGERMEIDGNDDDNDSETKQDRTLKLRLDLLSFGEGDDAKDNRHLRLIAMQQIVRINELLISRKELKLLSRLSVVFCESSDKREKKRLPLLVEVKSIVQEMLQHTNRKPSSLAPYQVLVQQATSGSTNAESTSAASPSHHLSLNSLPLLTSLWSNINQDQEILLDRIAAFVTSFLNSPISKRRLHSHQVKVFTQILVAEMKKGVESSEHNKQFELWQGAVSCLVSILACFCDQHSKEKEEEEEKDEDSNQNYLMCILSLVTFEEGNSGGVPVARFPEKLATSAVTPESTDRFIKKLKKCCSNDKRLERVVSDLVAPTLELILLARERKYLYRELAAASNPDATFILGKVWISVGLMMAHFLVPNRAIDPAVKYHTRLQDVERSLDDCRVEMSAVELDSELHSNHMSNAASSVSFNASSDRSESVAYGHELSNGDDLWREREEARLLGKSHVFESLALVRRPETPAFTQLHRELRNSLQSVFSVSRFQNVVPHDRKSVRIEGLRTCISSLRQLSLGLQRRYGEGYPDIITPMRAAIEWMQIGLNRVMMSAEDRVLSQHLPCVTAALNTFMVLPSAMPILDAIRALISPSLLSNLRELTEKARKKRKDHSNRGDRGATDTTKTASSRGSSIEIRVLYAALLQCEVFIHCCDGNISPKMADVLAEIFSRFVASWRRAREEHAERERKKSELYSFKEHVFEGNTKDGEVKINEDMDKFYPQFHQTYQDLTKGESLEDMLKDDKGPVGEAPIAANPKGNDKQKDDLNSDHEAWEESFKMDMAMIPHVFACFERVYGSKQKATPTTTAALPRMKEKNVLQAFEAGYLVAYELIQDLKSLGVAEQITRTFDSISTSSHLLMTSLAKTTLSKLPMPAEEEEEEGGGGGGADRLEVERKGADVKKRRKNSKRTRGAKQQLQHGPIELYESGSHYSAVEIGRVEKPLKIYMKRLADLLKEFEDHPMLVMLARIADRVGSLTSASPLIEVLTGLELILKKSQEWQAYVPSRCSLEGHLQGISNLVMRWRRMELETWSEALTRVERDYSKKATEAWCQLYEILHIDQNELKTFERKDKKKKDLQQKKKKKGQEDVKATSPTDAFLAELYLAATEFVQRCSLGELDTRLQILGSLRDEIIATKHSEASITTNKITDEGGRKLQLPKEVRRQMANILGNVAYLSRELREAAMSRISRDRKALESKLKDAVKLAKWDMSNYWALRASTRASHRKLCTISTQYTDLLAPSVSIIRLQIEEADAKQDDDSLEYGIIDISQLKREIEELVKERRAKRDKELEEQEQNQLKGEKKKRVVRGGKKKKMPEDAKIDNKQPASGGEAKKKSKGKRTRATKQEKLRSYSLHIGFPADGLQLPLSSFTFASQVKDKQEQQPGQQRQDQLVKRVRSLLRKGIFSQTYTRLHAQFSEGLQEISGGIIERSLALSLSHHKKIHHKKKGLVDLLRIMRDLGVSHRLSDLRKLGKWAGDLMRISRIPPLDAVFIDGTFGCKKSIISYCPGFEDGFQGGCRYSEKYFYRCANLLLKLRVRRTTCHSDISPSEASRASGYSEHLFATLTCQRLDLAKLGKLFASLSNALAAIDIHHRSDAKEGKEEAMDVCAVAEAREREEEEEQENDELPQDGTIVNGGSESSEGFLLRSLQSHIDDIVYSVTTHGLVLKQLPSEAGSSSASASSLLDSMIADLRSIRDHVTTTLELSSSSSLNNTPTSSCAKLWKSLHDLVMSRSFTDISRMSLGLQQIRKRTGAMYQGIKRNRFSDDSLAMSLKRAGDGGAVDDDISEVAESVLIRELKLATQNVYKLCTGYMKAHAEATAKATATKHGADEDSNGNWVAEIQSLKQGDDDDDDDALPLPSSLVGGTTVASTEQTLEEGQRHLRGVIQALRIEKITKALQNCPTGVATTTSSGIFVIQQLLSQLLSQVQKVVELLLSLHAPLSKLCYVMLKLCNALFARGFCRPPDEAEGDDEGDDDDDAAADGTGMGEGDTSGAKDVSNEIMDEEQLLGNSGDNNELGQQEEQSANKDEDVKEDEGLEMEQEFEGDMHDLPEDDDNDDNEENDDGEEEEELDREMGDLGEDKNAIDEKLWDGDSSEDDDDENQKEKEDDKIEKDAPVQGGDNIEQAAKDDGAEEEGKEERKPEDQKEQQQQEEDEKMPEMNEEKENEDDENDENPIRDGDEQYQENTGINPMEFPEELKLDEEGEEEEEQGDEDDGGEEEGNEGPDDLDNIDVNTGQELNNEEEEESKEENEDNQDADEEEGIQLDKDDTDAGGEEKDPENHQQQEEDGTENQGKDNLEAEPDDEQQNEEEEEEGKENEDGVSKIDTQDDEPQAQEEVQGDIGNQGSNGLEEEKEEEKANQPNAASSDPKGESDGLDAGQDQAEQLMQSDTNEGKLQHSAPKPQDEQPQEEDGQGQEAQQALNQLLKEPNPYRSLGDALKKWHEKLKMVGEEESEDHVVHDSDNNDDDDDDGEGGKDGDDEHPQGEFQHVKEDEKADAQVAAAADDQDVDESNLHEKEQDDSNEEDEQQLDVDQTETGEDKPHGGQNEQQDDDDDDQNKQSSDNTRRGSLRRKRDVQNEREENMDEDDDDLKLDKDDDENNNDQLLEQKLDDKDAEMPQYLIGEVAEKHVMGGGEEEEDKQVEITEEEASRIRQELDSAMRKEMANSNLDDAKWGEQWEKLTILTGGLSRRLCEQLRAILEPISATRLKGDYKAGKRINIKKVIPYIASQFRKDKIWMRRTKPDKRDYQVMIAIDDSESMMVNSAGTLALEALATLTQALNLLEVGDISVLSFGDRVNLIHPFGQPFSHTSGEKALSEFSFEQKTTEWAKLIKSVIQMLADARNSKSVRSRTSSGQQVLQLVFIISDARMQQDRDKVARWCREALHRGQLLVLLVVDSPDPKHSILKLRSVTYPNGKLKIVQYLEDFPFPFYIIMRDLSQLPEIVADTLKQWFELVQHCS